jgi:hypothetical protein
MDNAELERCLNDGDYLAKKYFQSHKFCMAYDKSSCNGNIIKAHTISEKHLKNIAKNGHIYVPVGSTHHKNSIYEFELKGVDKVTHINGFCSHHDNILFESFEKKEFCGTYNQIYDISFRSLAREFYQKKCLLLFYNEIKNGKLRAIDKTGYSQSEYFKENIFRTRREYKDLNFLYTQLKRYKKSGLSYLLLETSKLPISATGVFFPLMDYKGNRIQRKSTSQLGFIYNVLTVLEKSYIIFTSVNSLHNNVCRDFLLSMGKCKDDFKLNYLLTYFFFNNDNIAISPSWFDGLNDEIKGDLRKLMNFQVGHIGEMAVITEIIRFSKLIECAFINTKIVL